MKNLEMQTLALLVRGYTSTEIAKRLGVSRQAVTHQGRKAKKRLGAKTLCELGYLAGLAVKEARYD